MNPSPIFGKSGLVSSGTSGFFSWARNAYFSIRLFIAASVNLFSFLPPTRVYNQASNSLYYRSQQNNCGCDGKRLCDLLKNISSVGVGCPEIQMYRILDPVPILYRQRVVQSHLFPKRCQRLWCDCKSVPSRIRLRCVNR